MFHLIVLISCNKLTGRLSPLLVCISSQHSTKQYTLKDYRPHHYLQHVGKAKINLLFSYNGQFPFNRERERERGSEGGSEGGGKRCERARCEASPVTRLLSQAQIDLTICNRC